MVTLEPWGERRAEVFALRLEPEQSRFMSGQTVAEFLADADEHPTFEAFAICAAGRVVGMVSYGREPGQSADERWISLMVVGREWQRRGYGRAALEATVARVRSEGAQCRRIGLSCHPGNDAALALYAGTGFRARGMNEKGEVEMCLELREE